MAKAEQDEAIAFLSDPGRAGLGPVEMIETHGSMVFLTGDRAFKRRSLSRARRTASWR